MVPYNQREFDLFLSYAHKDESFIHKLYEWLTQKAGLKIWYDNNAFSHGAYLGGGLQDGLEKCRGILLINSDGAFDPAHGWIRKEYECAQDLNSQDPNYRVIVVNTPNADKSKLLKGYTWINMESEDVTLKLGLEIINAYYGNNHIIPQGAKDIYVSCSWRTEDYTSAQTVCKHLIGLGFRLIGDSKDQKGFDSGNRVEKIIQSCGAFVCIIPFRNETKASADEGAYKYFIKEILLARKNEVPTYVFADPRVELPPIEGIEYILFETSNTICSQEVKNKIEPLLTEWEDPKVPQYIFYSLDFDFEYAKPGSNVRGLMEKITSLPTFTGWEIKKTTYSRISS